MSAPLFTPGPWLLEPRFVYALNRHQINRFSLSVQGGYADEGRTSTEELDANANLIAAAPDMFAALEMQRNWLKGYISNGGLSGLEELIAIEAALKRARGQS